MHGVLCLHLHWPDLDLPHQQLRSLLDGALASVDAQRLHRWHVPRRGQAEAAFAAVYDIIKEELERRPLIHATSLV